MRGGAKKSGAFPMQSDQWTPLSSTIVFSPFTDSFRHGPHLHLEPDNLQVQSPEYGVQNALNRVSGHKDTLLFLSASSNLEGLAVQWFIVLRPHPGLGETMNRYPPVAQHRSSDR
jgi:hypothetical protein